MIDLKYVAIYVISVFISSASQIVLKKSANKKHITRYSEYINRFVILGYTMFFVSLILTIVAFKGLSLKFGPAIESLGYVFIIFFANFFLHEKITTSKIIGTIVIVIGILIFSYK